MRSWLNCCNNCGAEYHIDVTNRTEEPTYCPYCGTADAEE